MKKKIISLQRIRYLLAILFILTRFSSIAQNPSYNLIKPGSTKDWIDFRDDVTVTVDELFNTYKYLLELDELDEMRLVSKSQDKIGMTNYVFDQYYLGYRIDGARIIVHELNGRVKSINGKTVSGFIQKPTLAINERTAFNKAVTKMGKVKFFWEDPETEELLRENNNDESATWYPKGELVWSRASATDEFIPSNFKLCWVFEMRVTSETGNSQKVFVDALNGEIRRQIPLSVSCDDGTGETSWYGERGISTDVPFLGSNYRLIDDCTGSHDYKITTKNKNNGGSTTNYEDGDNNWTSSADEDGVTAHWCMHRTLDYYSVVHDRNSYNNSGHNVSLFTNVMFGGSTSNAQWNGSEFLFGDGNSTDANDDFTTMDIVAHEFTHAVTDYSAELEYAAQSGALNESFSDIFGTVVEEWTGAGTFDWDMGEDMVGTATVRYMSDPNLGGDPDTYLGTYWADLGGDDDGGVHTNSGVQNFMFYLLCEGGSGTNDNGDAYSVTGIGIDAAADIAYRALTEYLTSTSQYPDAREAWIRAAEDLFGSCSEEVIQTANAWFAVGVTTVLVHYDYEVCGTLIPLFSPLTYNGIHSVTGGGDCTTTIVADMPYPVSFVAADVIYLKDGFTAEAGSTFYAIIDECNLSYYAKTSNPSSEDVHDDFPSAIQEENILNVYPSPFNEYFVIQLKGNQGQAFSIKLCDITGAVVKYIAEQKIFEGPEMIETVTTDNLPPGIYFVEYFSGNEKTTQKIVKIN